jgi:predicted ATP-dependent endonuclease of OLD family
VGEVLQKYWPSFLYFDSFADQLPRSIDVAVLRNHIKARNANANVSAPQPGQQAAEDFLHLAGVDLEEVIRLKDNDKSLNNYLTRCTAQITGDFLTYWKQSVDGKQTVKLHVRHTRNAAGVLWLSFYVHDGVDQYPEQRSKGFLWFLSFYLRLAADQKRNGSGIERFLLIDEPGTYLHAKAQRDVLHLLEEKFSREHQVIYSTHSPYLIPADKLHRLRIVLRDGSKGTQVLDRLTHPSLRGEAFSDTLSPVITAIGLDIRDRIGGLSDRNLLVEGLSDHIYLSVWCAQLKADLFKNIRIFPGTGAGSLPTLASLCIGWGLDFCVLLDRDDEGLKTALKFERQLGLNSARIIHPSNAITIEDVFDVEDFKLLLKSLDPSFDLKGAETASKAIKRQSVDKILLARKFAETPLNYSKSAPAFTRLLQTIETAFGFLAVSPR